MYALLVDLLPWLAAFLALDCLAEPRRGARLLISSGGELDVSGPGLRFTPPWPTTEVVPVVDLPWLAEAGGLHLIEPGRRPELHVVEPGDLAGVAWAGLVPVAEGKKVTSGGRLLATFPAGTLARHGAAQLVELGAAADRPEALVAQESPGRDLEAALALRRRQRPWLWPLRLAGGALWLGLFGLGTLVATGVVGRALPAAWLVAGLGASYLGLLVLAAGMLRSCGRSWRETAQGAGALVAWPVAALRPLVTLSPMVYASLDGLAVAAALLPARRFTALAALELGRLELSRAACGPATAAAWGRRERHLEALLGGAGLDVAEARRPPRRLPGEERWCPACRAGFRADPARCPDCGVALRPFPADPPGATG